MTKRAGVETLSNDEQPNDVINSYSDEGILLHLFFFGKAGLAPSDRF